jgi:hypothetical protein
MSISASPRSASGTVGSAPPRPDPGQPRRRQRASRYHSHTHRRRMPRWPGRRHPDTVRTRQLKSAQPARLPRSLSAAAVLVLVFDTRRALMVFRRSLRRYGLANVMATRTVVAGPDGFAAITVQAPARWAGSSEKCSEQTSCEPLRLHSPAWWDERRMLGKTAPYQVRILTATSVDAPAVTLTSNAYLAGLGAVITYWAEARPLAIIRFATCGLPMTLVARACSSLW